MARGNLLKRIKKQVRAYKYKSIKSDFILSRDDTIQQRGELVDQAVFNGGPVHNFSTIGRLYLITLLKVGITPDSKVLDLGCGALRGGYWLIHFLQPNRYFGIEPHKEMLEAGKRLLLEEQTIAYKKPQFDHNDTFDFSVFSEKFDFVVARSIWTHASKLHIQKMLDEFVINTSRNGVFLTSYFKPFFNKQDYQGSEWVGKSHSSDKPGIVFHRLSWIDQECKKRNLRLRELKFDYFDQIWLHISK